MIETQAKLAAEKLVRPSSDGLTYQDSRFYESGVLSELREIRSCANGELVRRQAEIQGDYPVKFEEDCRKGTVRILTVNGTREIQASYTHVAQGTGQGNFARLFGELSNSIAAFWQDLGPDYQQRVAVMTMTEFGRTVHQNGSNGTDHGRGSCMFVLGNDVKGGKVYGNVAALSKDALEDGRDLPVSTDFRSLFSDVATSHLKLAGGAGQLFPGWSGPSLGVV